MADLAAGAVSPSTTPCEMWQAGTVVDIRGKGRANVLEPPAAAAAGHGCDGGRRRVRFQEDGTTYWCNPQRLRRMRPVRKCAVLGGARGMNVCRSAALLAPSACLQPGSHPLCNPARQASQLLGPAAPSSAEQRPSASARAPGHLPDPSRAPAQASNPIVVAYRTELYRAALTHNLDWHMRCLEVGSHTGGRGPGPCGPPSSGRRLSAACDQCCTRSSAGAVLLPCCLSAPPRVVRLQRISPDAAARGFSLPLTSL